jgi:nitrite reductase/ring-hydroxylating ferredoxin subunit
MKTSDSNDGFIKICSIDEITENSGRRFIVDDVEVALFKIDKEIFALSNICPHQHTALIYDGFIEDGCIICPAHGWMFNLKTGKTPSGGKGLDTYETKIIQGDIYIKVFEKNFNW